MRLRGDVIHCRKREKGKSHIHLVFGLPAVLYECATQLGGRGTSALAGGEGDGKGPEEDRIITARSKAEEAPTSKVVSKTHIFNTKFSIASILSHTLRIGYFKSPLLL